MTELDLVLAAIDQYVEQSKDSYSKQAKNLAKRWLLWSPSGIDRATDLSNLLIRMSATFEEEKPQTEVDEGFELIEPLPKELKSNNTKQIHLFIEGYLNADKNQMKKAVSACGLETEKINFDALIDGNENTDSLRAIIRYWLTLKTTLNTEVAPPSFFEGSHDKSKVKRILPNFNAPRPEVMPTKGGKQKTFQDGFVYARTEEIKEEFEKEAQLRSYVEEHAFNLLEHMSFQTQDETDPLRAGVSVYGFDNEDLFGYETLDVFIAKAEERKYSPRQILQIIDQIFDIIHQFWLAGISHQDLHSGNIKIIPDGPYNHENTYFQVKIFDYGNARFNRELAHQDLLIDWSYLLRGRSATVSDEIGRSIVSWMPVETEVNKKHYPIIKLMQLLDPQAKFKQIFNKNTEHFLNALKYANTLKPEKLNYIYNNFKYAFFTGIEENIHHYEKIQPAEKTEKIDTETTAIEASDYKPVINIDPTTTLIIEEYNPSLSSSTEEETTNHNDAPSSVLRRRPISLSSLPNLTFYDQEETEKLSRSAPSPYHKTKFD
ncbi:hypothetical protein L3V82_05625 [Thiotrichales bacterium 19S3-7]|nr:hypothetical protein [Thiotrichales bacterium 19S3-7]MCF6801573.1 hypothetical protein [Thiotrichales bacterium 19S3-11]